MGTSSTFDRGQQGHGAGLAPSAPVGSGFAECWRETGLAPLRAIRMFGMRRSGNHAIADWILRNAGGSGSVFLNNCVPGQSPARAFRTLAVNRDRKSVKDAKADLPAVCTDAGTAATLLVTYEDTPPDERRARPMSGDAEDGFDTDVIIYRSFLNWSASLLKKLQRNPGYSGSQRASIVLKSIDGYRRMLNLVAQQEALALVPICYDDWQKSGPYRAGRLTALGLNVIHNTTGTVQTYGGGSSFQDTDVPVDRLSTDRRFEQMADDPDYAAILSIAARDDALTEQLERQFPADLERLAQFAGQRATR